MITIATLLVLLCICLLVIVRLCERPEPRVEAVRWVPVSVGKPAKWRNQIAMNRAERAEKDSIK